MIKTILSILIALLASSVYADQQTPTASVAKVNTILKVLSVYGEGTPLSVDIYYHGHTVLLDTKFNPILGEDRSSIVQAVKKLVGEESVTVLVRDYGDSAAWVQPQSKGAARAYNAVASPALTINWGTSTCKKVQGKWVSLEDHTPITTTALKMLDSRGCVKGRVNVGTTPDETLTHGLEVLHHWLTEGTVNVTRLTAIRNSNLSITGDPSVSVPLHMGTIGELSKAVLKYSSNAAADLLGYKVAHAKFGIVNSSTVQDGLTADRRYGTYVDGSGLSLGNKASHEQILALMEAFLPYKHLLPTPENYRGFSVKTGTLPSQQIYTLVGYINNKPFFIRAKSSRDRLSQFNRLIKE